VHQAERGLWRKGRAARDAREPKGKVGRGKVGTREFQ